MTITIRSITSAEPNASFHMSNWVNGKTVVGPNVNTLLNKTQNECQKFCEADDQCLFAVFDNRANTCYLRGAETNSSATTGLRNEYGYDQLQSTYISSPGKITNAGANGCQAACTNDPTCNYYTVLNGVCKTNSFTDDANYSMSIKLTNAEMTPLSPDDATNLSCCMNSVTNPNVNCGDLLPFSKTCDTFMEGLCLNNKNLPQCRCINRKDNPSYLSIKNKLPPNILDECWYPYCQANYASGNPNEKAYIPTNMIPTSITFYENGGINQIDNIKCAGSVKCNLTSLVNPDLKANCTFLDNMRANYNTNNPNKTPTTESFVTYNDDNSAFWLIILIIILIIVFAATRK